MTELEDKSVDMVMTSPPYYSLRNYGKDGQIGLEDSIEDYISNLMLIFDESYRVLKDDESWVVIGDSYRWLFGKYSTSVFENDESQMDTKKLCCMLLNESKTRIC